MKTFKKWSTKEEQYLETQYYKLIGNTTRREIAAQVATHLGRTYKSVHQKIDKLQLPSKTPIITNKVINKGKREEKVIHKWTPKEDRVLIRNIKKYPDNLSHAFRVTASSINCSDKSCMNRWYYNIKYRDEVCFMTISKSKSLKNGKNNKRKNGHYNHNYSFLRVVNKFIKDYIVSIFRVSK